MKEKKQKNFFFGRNRRACRYSCGVLAVDLGGGSTGVVMGTCSGEGAAAASMDVGCVRMRERHLPATASDSQLAGARRDVRTALVVWAWNT